MQEDIVITETNNDSRVNLIRERLNARLKPVELEIIDNSEQHQKHRPAVESGGGHFTVVINSSQFKDKPLLDCHRMVYDALNDIMHSEIHALRIKITNNKNI